MQGEDRIMPKQYTSKQIAAHIADSYINEEKDTGFIRTFEKSLERRVPVLRKSGDKECYQDVCSMLYCLRDMRGSCRDAGENFVNGDMRESDRFINGETYQRDGAAAHRDTEGTPGRV